MKKDFYGNEIEEGNLIRIWWQGRYHEGVAVYLEGDDGEDHLFIDLKQSGLIKEGKNIILNVSALDAFECYIDDLERLYESKLNPEI